jgi:hypothetical protein
VVQKQRLTSAIFFPCSSAKEILFSFVGLCMNGKETTLRMTVRGDAGQHMQEAILTLFAQMISRKCFPSSVFSLVLRLH